MTKQVPKFSIIVPVYNNLEGLDRCLESILNQSVDDYEVIIVNDGCTDNTQTLIDEYTEVDDRFIGLKQKNSGIGVARALGINHATGEYIVSVDSDDTINPKLLEKLLPHTSLYTGIDIIRFQARVMNDFTEKNGFRYTTPKTDSILNGEEAIVSWAIKDKEFTAYWISCFRRSVFDNSFGFPDKRIYEDFALLPLIIASAKQIITIDYVGCNHVINGNSLTNNFKESALEERYDAFLNAYDHVIANFKELAVKDSTKEAFELYCKQKMVSTFNDLTPALQETFMYELLNRGVSPRKL